MADAGTTANTATPKPCVVHVLPPPPPPPPAPGDRPLQQNFPSHIAIHAVLYHISCLILTSPSRHPITVITRSLPAWNVQQS
ncbi:hypothetical protein E2C01_042244 [Portunus trituberculatus]|uniref:Uncharacterized protein n=1 Tax=Portunus trituberculatus TaxID=210409 RepID=A0A5B7FLY4_PORTR|nr:hypothetical protein [Portunus trituberculatus]